LLASVGVDGIARVYSADGSRLFHTCKDKDWDKRSDNQLDAVALSPDSDLLVCGGTAKTVFLWDARSGRELPRLANLNATIRALAFAPSGNQLAVATSAELLLFDRVGNKFRFKKRLLEGQYVVAAVAYSGDGKRLAACTYHPSVFTWDLATLTRTECLRIPGIPEGQHPTLEAIALSGNGSRIIFASREGGYFLWEPPQPPRRLGTTNPNATTLAFVPGQDAFVFTGGWDSPLQLCDLAAGGRIRSFAATRENNRSLCFAPDGKLLAMASSDGSVYLWDVLTVAGVAK
jgi:WD40 repeat protein